MRIVQKRRSLCSTIALAAGLLPFAPGLALDRSIAPKEDATTDSQTTPTSHTDRKTDLAKLAPQAPGAGTPEAFELKVNGSGGRWSLPTQDAKSGWLVAVGIGSQGESRHRVRIHARPTGGPASTDQLVALPPVGRNPGPPDSEKHVVAKHRNLTRPAALAPARERREFAIQTFAGDANDQAFYETIDGRLTRSGEKVAIYVDERDLATVSPEALDSIVEVIDELIPSRLTPRIGDVADTDGDGRLTILVSQVLSRMAEGTAVLDGFVRASDFERWGAYPRSHACDMIYVNSRVQAGPFLKSLLAHEFTHAVIASARAAGAGQGKAAEIEDSWLDEGLAHLSERWIDDNWENLDYRIAEFLAEPQRHRLVVNDQIGLAHGRSHGHRGAAFLFLDWCRERFGDDLPAKLITGSKTGVANLEDATGTPFESLFRSWTVELMTQASGQIAFDKVRDQALRDDWLVGVPRASELSLEADGLPCVAEWTSEGTAVRLFRISPPDSGPMPDTIELKVDAPAEARIQVTAIPLKDMHRGLDFEVISTGETRPDGKSTVRLRLTNRDPSRSLKIQAAAWESPLPGLDARELRQRRGFFDLLTLASSLGSITILPGQSLVSAPIEVAFAPESSEPMRWKVVAHDDSGRPVFSWADDVSGKRFARPLTPRIASDISTDRPGTIRR